MTPDTLFPVRAPDRGRRPVFLRRLGMPGVAAATSLAILGALAIFGPILWATDPNRTDLLNRFAQPAWEHPFGTDALGRDMLARMFHGARVSLAGAIVVLLGSTGLGMVAGAMCAALGGKFDTIGGRVIDGLLSLPSLVVALAIVGVLGRSIEHLLLALVLTSWPWYARIYRGFVVNERHQTYVSAAVTSVVRHTASHGGTLARTSPGRRSSWPRSVWATRSSASPHSPSSDSESRLQPRSGGRW